MSNSTVQAVRGAVKISTSIGDVGQIITGWKALEVTNTILSSSDHFSVTFAASALPPDYDAAWFMAQQDLYASIWIGSPADPTSWTAGELPNWIYGRVDDVSYDPVDGTVSISGRDMTAPFVDAKTTEKFQNITSSQVAEKLAIRHGLQYVGTPTSTPVGKYYEIDHEAMTDSHTEWQLLNHLAKLEQYTVRVRGKTLFFQPLAAMDDATPYPITWTAPSGSQGFPSSNTVALSFARALSVSRGVKVVCRCFNDVQGKVLTATCQSSGTPGPNVQTYYYTMHNESQQSLQQAANAKYRQIVQHEMKMTAELPGDDVLDVTMSIQVSGTGTACDQTYYPESVKRSLSFDSGYTMTLEAKNSAPDDSTSEG